MKPTLLLIVIALASFSGFFVHVLTIEWLPGWISAQMQNTSVEASWNVRYWAAIMSIEYGVAAMALYHLAREKLLKLGLLGGALAFSALLSGVHAAVIRQPVMDFVVGNPVHVVLVQNGFKWLVWLLMGVIVALGYELVKRISANKQQ